MVPWWKNTGTSVILVWVGVQNPKKPSLNVKDKILSKVLPHLAWDDDIKLCSISWLSRSFIANAFWSCVPNRVSLSFSLFSVRWGRPITLPCVLWPKLVQEKTVRCVHVGCRVTPGGTTPRLDCNPYKMCNSFLFSGVSLLLWGTSATIPDCWKATSNLISIDETIV